MRIDAVARTSSIGPEKCLTGVSAALAEARKMFLTAAPEKNWADVMAQAGQVRAGQDMTLLHALQVVYNQMAAGR